LKLETWNLELETWDLVLLLADSCVASNDPVVELVVAELADAILRFAMLKVALDFFLALNTRIGLVGFHSARRERRREYEGQDEENEGDSEQEWSFHGCVPFIRFVARLA